MIRFFLSFFMVVLLFVFALKWTELNSFFIVLIFLILTLFFCFGNIKYFYAKKMVFVDGVFAKNGVLKSILSGKFTSFLSSFCFGFILAFVILFNLLYLGKFDFLFIFIVCPFVFLLAKFCVKFVFGKEFKRVEFVRIFEILSAAVLLSIFSIFLPAYDNPNVSIFAEFYALRELYSFKVLISNFALFLSSKSYLFNILFILNQFGFYLAICYFCSLIFSSKTPKIGYFVGTIALFAYLSIVMILSFNLQKYKQTSDTKIHSVARFIINLETNSSIAISKNDANEIKGKIDYYQNLSLNEIKIYLDESFELGAKKVAKELADFHFSVFADYVILFHSIVDDEKKYMQNLLENAIKNGFDPDMNLKLSQIIDKNFELLNGEISSKISAIAKIDEIKLENSFNSQFLQDKKLRVSTSAGLGFGSMILAKASAKSLAKFGSKMAASGTAASSGIACGTFAPLCSIVLASATWIGFDAVFAKGDEAINRAKFEEEIYQFFMQEKDEILRNLTTEIQKGFDLVRGQILF